MKPLIERIKECKTQEELDRLRREIVNEGRKNGMDSFRPLQQAFITQKEKIANGWVFDG
jgi:predicted 3-demethylubiquinone-9 3-methyltransferase (glyoxalase superfamily)